MWSAISEAAGKNSQVENYDFWGQMAIGPNPSSPQYNPGQVPYSLSLCFPFFKRGIATLMLQIFMTIKLDKMFKALCKVFDAW